MKQRNKRSKRRRVRDNRLNVVMAIVFLLGGLVILKLFTIQVLKYDLYTAVASSQHKAFNELAPERGRIFIQDSTEFMSENLYPLATNKEFAHIYAIPSKVSNPNMLSEKLFEMLDKAEVEEEVEKLLEEDEFFIELADETITAERYKELTEFREVKKEAEIVIRTEKIMSEYNTKLSKKNDPYEPIRKKVEKEDAEVIKNDEIEGTDYFMELFRYYPERNIGSHLLGFVGFSEDTMVGRYGLEGYFDKELSGVRGSVRSERSAKGTLIILKDREYTKPINGSDLILTINRSIQYEACASLNKAALRHGADGGTVIVMEPNTGAILAMCNWPDYDPNKYNQEEDINVFNNPAIFHEYEPGSIYKTITMAASIDMGKITPETFYQDNGFLMIEGWHKPIKNSDFETKGGHGWVDMNYALEESLNTGAIYAMLKMGPENFAEYVKKFGFGEKTGIELETETQGNIINLERNTIRPVEAATASFGQGITATPIQMISSYAAIANGGILMKPYMVGEIITPSGERQKTEPRAIRRVVSERTALLTSGMLVNVVRSGHAAKAGVDGYYVGGKTGTAQVADVEKKGYSEKTIHTFVGFGPAEDPKFVMLVKLDDPKDVSYSADSAAPLFGELAEFILNYYQVPKDREGI